jgi:hypothetical protein
VWWRGSCLRYAAQRDGSPKLGLDVSVVQALLKEEFGRWSDAACDTEATPAFLAQSQGNVACADAEFNCDARERNANVVIFVDREWHNSPFQIALTTLSINTATGEILDADIEVNSESYELRVDPPAGTAIDLRMVLAHEIGHFLGLSHSNDMSALMREGGTPSPDLKPDDVLGICAIFPHSATDPSCASPPSADGAECQGDERVCRGTEAAEGCGCSVPGGRGGFAATALCALAVCVAGFRRRHRQQGERAAPEPGKRAGQRIATVLLTVMRSPLNAGTCARRIVAAMQPPVSVPANGLPVTTALVTRPDGANVTTTTA